MALALTCLAVSVVANAVVASAAGTGEYARWTLSGSSGTLTAPGSHLPAGTFTTDATRKQTPSGESTFLGPTTPFGEEFGASKGHNYLMFGTASGNRQSTTTITFDADAPAGQWGFALGDIDADTAQISATDASGNELTAAELGWKGAFNYCEKPPRPSSCPAGANTDKPNWNPGTRTLVGNVKDTSGASGWFMPTKPVRTLTIRFSVQTGIPVGQLWIAAKTTPPPPPAKPDVIISKVATPDQAGPGDTVTYTITVTNRGKAPENHASVGDDLSDVLPAARYDDNARSSSGSVSYSKPMLFWHGAVEPGKSQKISYSVTIYNPPRAASMRNVVITYGQRLSCPDGHGHGCVSTVEIEGGACRVAARPGVSDCRPAGRLEP